jgi:fumarate reductase subunit C
MSRASVVIAGVGLADVPRKSRWPAFMDVTQSASGLVLALFMWGHMFFVSSILLGYDAMWTITKAFEGYFFFGRAHPWIVSVIVGIIAAVFVLHAALAMRKFPANYRQYRAFIGQYRLIHHHDTTLWWVQAVTGFMLFFLAFPHLYQMLMHPGAIGPYQSGTRFWSGWWPLYLVLLFAVELHGGIGLYRVVVKWGIFEGKDANATRRTLVKVKWALTAFFLALGLLTFAAYMKIGYQVSATPDAVYTPAWLRNPPQAEPPAWWPRWLKEDKQ